MSICKCALLPPHPLFNGYMWAQDKHGGGSGDAVHPAN